jgi:TetR/AcrR family transcriptional repressor of mexJK operon
MLDPETLSPEKREQVLKGAAIVFASDGYEGASMSRIAHEAGVSKGTLYNYFETKAHLFAAYVGQECRFKLEQVFAPAQLDGTPDEVLRGIGSRMMAMMMSPTGLTIYRVVTSEAGKFPELAKIFYDAGPARWIDCLAEWLRRETLSGRLNVADPGFAAEQFFALCQTRLYLRRMLRMDHVTTPEEAAHVVESAVSMFLTFYTAKPRAI